MPIDMKNVIADTFAAMVKQKGLDKVTVKALIDACHISWQTFYYHFQDIMEVIEWSVARESESMLARSLEAESPEDAVCILLSSAWANRTLIQKLMASQKREQVEGIVVQSAKTYLQKLIQGKTDRLPIPYADFDVALDLLAFGLSGVILKCCRQPQIDVKKLSAQICRVLTGRNREDMK